MLWMHLAAPLWRRLGRSSYLIHAPVYLAMVGATALSYPIIGSGPPPMPGLLYWPGAALVASGLALLASTYRHIDSWTAMAGPQLTNAESRRLITGGIYGVIRHPRYLVLLLGAWGNLLMLGGSALLLAAIATTVLTPVLVRVEERELAAYFGDAWFDYATRVPALVPRIRRSSGSGS